MKAETHNSSEAALLCRRDLVLSGAMNSKECIPTTVAIIDDSAILLTQLLTSIR